MQTKTNEQTGTESNRPAHGARARGVVLRILLICGVVAACIYGWRALHPPKSSALRVSGRIEGYETNVGAKIGGKVNFIKYREGAKASKGELIVRVSDDDIQAQLRGAEARIRQAEQQQDQAEAQIKVVESQIEEAKIGVHQSREDMQGRILQARATFAASQSQLSEAEAQLQQSEADMHLAAIRKERYGSLVVKGAVTQDQYDQAAATYEATKATVEARRSAVESARKQVRAQQGLLAQAVTTRLNPPIKSAQVLALEKQLQASQAQFRAAKQAVDNAVAAAQEIQANIAYLNIPSPITGIVTARPVEPGAGVVPGQTVLSLINLDTVYLRAFVPEGDIGRVRVGQRAQVFLDSAPDRPIDAQVIEIDPVASFTPENIYFQNDRVKQVFGIKIGITNPAGFCKPGMPADADILVSAR